VIALSFAVDYWDELGWKDTFARPAYTARQWDYAKGLGRRNVATPQMVIGGRRDIVGQNRAEIDRSIAAVPRPLAITMVDEAATVPKGPAAKAEVWLVRYDPRVRAVAIKRGENNGKTLPHRNIVTELKRLGEWTGEAKTYGLPAASDAQLRTAVLVQARGGPILAAGVR
jgi:hypothetical protein